METSILHNFKKKAGMLLESKLLKTGQVLEVRHWEQGTIVEVDLHLPLEDMKQWKEVPYIKFQVDHLCFRDYTPFGWDAGTATCSLLIDSAHQGPGSSWAKYLQAGDKVHYLKVEGTHQSPHPTDLVVGLGDASSLAHILALQQLTLPVSRFEGAVLLDNQHTGKQFHDYFHPPLKTLTNLDELTEWLLVQNYCTAHTWFYLTGNNSIVSQMRRSLRNTGHTNIRIKGFWS
jgi:NADPH-dependent ferric siderophore reductase